MSNETLADRIESLAERLVLMDASVPESFSGLEETLTELAILLRAADDEQAVEDCVRGVHLIEATAQRQVAPESAHDALCGLIGNLQHTYCHGLEADEFKSRIAAWESEANPTPLSPLADDRILGEFLGRQEMVIDELEGLLLSLEKESQGEALHRCRRLIHTLKGESSLLGMVHVERVCHAMEEGLSQSRIDALFQAKDWLSAAFNRYAGKSVSAESPGALIARLTGQPDLGAPPLPAWTPVPLDPTEDEEGESAPTGFRVGTDIPETLSAITVPADTDPSLLADFLGESSEHLESIDVSLMTLETDPANGDCLNAVFRAFHTIKGLTGFLNLHPIRVLAHESENLLDKLRSGEMALNAERSEVLFASVDGMRKLIGLLDPSARAEAPVPLRELIVRIRSIAEGRPAAAKPQAENPKRPPPQPETRPTLSVSPKEPLPQPAVPAKASDAGFPAMAVTEKPEPPGKAPAALQLKETVKIEADRLDRLLDTIGELVIAEAMIVQSSELKGKVSAAMVQRLSHLDKITRNLQEMGTSLRMVPIRPVFQKMARLVRDLSHKCGKPIDFVTAGEHTELDKAVVDRIADPLVHMVRNAVDHGIEPDTEDRVRAGKPASAHLKLSAYQKGGNICIELEDDGRGLNREAILRKAFERGLLQGDGAGLDDKDVWAFIFEPGFSTASQITEVSGRGVGMDVVKRTFEELRGRIEIESRPGRGTRFVIWLPLTMAIIDGMVVRVGKERCIFPTLSVTTIMPYRETESGTAFSRHRLVEFQGRQVPVHPLESFFGDPPSDPDRRRLCVMAETGGKAIGFLVDDLLGKQQIVIKSLGDAFKDIPGLAGGAILSDGGIGLILDIDGLARAVRESGRNGLEPTTPSAARTAAAA